MMRPYKYACVLLVILLVTKVTSANNIAYPKCLENLQKNSKTKNLSKCWNENWWKVNKCMKNKKNSKYQKNLLKNCHENFVKVAESQAAASENSETLQKQPPACLENLKNNSKSKKYAACITWPKIENCLKQNKYKKASKSVKNQLRSCNEKYRVVTDSCPFI